MDLVNLPGSGFGSDVDVDVAVAGGSKTSFSVVVDITQLIYLCIYLFLLVNTKTLWVLHPAKSKQCKRKEKENGGK